MRANYDCPDCGGQLVEDGRDPAYAVIILACTHCQARITERPDGWAA